MRRTVVVAGVAALSAGVLGLAWFGLYLAQPIFGYSDTDNPALGVQFVRDHPQVFAWTGVTMIVMAIVLVVAVSSVGEIMRSHAGWPIRAASTLGLFAALLFLVFGVMRIGATGPLLHVADQRAEWGETAYLVVQMAGVQGVLPAGLFAFGAWATGLSLIGGRSRAIPRAVAVLGVVPLVHVLARVLGEVDLVPEELWLLMILSIPGTIAWCVLLGIGLLVRGFRMPADERAPVAAVATAQP